MPIELSPIYYFAIEDTTEYRNFTEAYYFFLFSSMFLLRSFEKNLHVSWKNLHALIRKENFNSSENTDYFELYEYNKIKE